MIFITVGTWHRGFDRLLREVHRLIDIGHITDTVCAQIGHSSFHSPLMTNIPFLDADAFAQHIAGARIIIAHAGVGSICQGVDAGKPIIVVPRLSALGEADNDHQFTTARQFESENKVLVAYDIACLPELLQQAETFVPSAISRNQELLSAVQSFVRQAASQHGA